MQSLVCARNIGSFVDLSALRVIYLILLFSELTKTVVAFLKTQRYLVDKSSD
jgi:hypothetical protein